MENTKTQTLKIGQRFFYTGDMANLSSWGTITGIKECSMFGITYDVEYDEERFEEDTKKGTAQPLSFNKGIGQRFKTEEQYRAEINEAREKLQKIKGRK